MRMSFVIFATFLLDLLLGDRSIGPLPHPVVVIGAGVTALERALRRRFPATSEGELGAGALLSLIVPGATLVIASIVCSIARRFSPLAGFALQTIWCWQSLALKGLDHETACVQGALEAGEITKARLAVARVVGRDTDVLDEAGIVRAATETIAENFSDGVVAPLIYMAIGGAPLALTYKAVNTLDSMVGYRTEVYEYLGKASAKLDDVANYLPARVAALTWIAAAAVDGQDAERAWSTWCRDRNAHASPNAAQCESACAGALGVQLGGPATYGGVTHEKPTLGVGIHPLTPQVIGAARRTLLVAGAIAFGLVVGLRVIGSLAIAAWRKKQT